MTERKGYTILILMVVVFVLSIGLLVAIPVWETQIQREKEEELIFRGKQYVEAIRIFQMKYPGSFPQSLDELMQKKCLRKLYKDPMTAHGEWNIILLTGRAARRRQQQSQRSSQIVLVAPLKALSSIDTPRIIGIVSSSTKKSIRIYFDQDTYDKWLFFYGQDPRKMPEIIYYGEREKD